MAIAVDAYQCDPITNLGAGLSPVGLSLAMDSSDQPIIAYQNASDPLGFSTLDVARPISAHGFAAGTVDQWSGLSPDGNALPLMM